MAVLLLVSKNDPPQQWPPVTMQERLEHFDNTLAGIEATQADMPFHAWPEHRQELWQTIKTARDELAAEHDSNQ